MNARAQSTQKAGRGALRNRKRPTWGMLRERKNSAKLRLRAEPGIAKPSYASIRVRPTHLGAAEPLSFRVNGLSGVPKGPNPLDGIDATALPGPANLYVSAPPARSLKRQTGAHLYKVLCLRAAAVMENAFQDSSGGIAHQAEAGATPIMTPDEIEELFLGGGDDVQKVVNPDGEEVVVLSDAEKTIRREVLRQVLGSVSQLWQSGSEDLDQLAEKIGDGSRDPLWRIPLGESGILEFFLGVAAQPGLRPTLAIHTLRIIGNACADTDENRARVVSSGGMPTIVNGLADDALLAFVIPVLFNVCVDYEPAQVAAYKAGLNPVLINMMLSEARLGIAANFITITCKLLAMIANQEPEADLVHPTTPFTLLTIAINQTFGFDLEDFLGATSVAITYLSHPQFQESFLMSPNATEVFLTALQKAYTGFNDAQQDPSEVAELRKVQSVFLQALADLSAQPGFSVANPLGSRSIDTLNRWIETPQAQLQSAACLALGNIARSDETCTYFVQTAMVHRPLIATLINSSTAETQLLHSVLSFLKNLAIPATNKPILGDAGLLDPGLLPRFWAMDAQPQVQFAAVSLTRLLLANCPVNVGRFCAPLSADPSSPAHDRSLLHVLLDLYDRTDQEPAKMEAARSVAAVCRVVHSPQAAAVLPPVGPPSPTASASSPPPATSPLQKFHNCHPRLLRPLEYMATQNKFPFLRSEVWFVFATMARTEDGVRPVARSFQDFDLVRKVVEAVTGRDMVNDMENASWNSADAASSSSPSSVADSPDMLSPPIAEPMQIDASTAASIKRADRENGLVLISELVRQEPVELKNVRPLVFKTFREIARNGGKFPLLEDKSWFA